MFTSLSVSLCHLHRTDKVELYTWCDAGHGVGKEGQAKRLYQAPEVTTNQFEQWPWKCGYH